ncbi:MAG: DNA mismatch repair protein MutS [Acidobacteriota bacterium]
MPVAAETTPMLRHYLELKARHPDALLFYRMGDFFELFFEDAQEAARLLELTLTARGRGTGNEAPMCGVPHHAAPGYIARLLKIGRKVVLCDQVEDPAQAKGLVKREVTRIYTPGTLSDTALLEGREENLLAALLFDGEAGAGAFLDVSTGAFHVRRFGDVAEALAELEASRPRELLAEVAALPTEIAAWAAREVACVTAPGSRLEGGFAAAERLKRHFGVSTLRGFGLDEGEPAVRAAAAALAYAQENQLSGLEHVRELVLRATSDRLVLDGPTLANLELFRAARDGGRKGTLLDRIDRTRTAPGGRLVRDWLRRPLRDPSAISERQDAVAALVEDPARRDRVAAVLARIADFERLASRAVVGTLAPREAAALRDSLAAFPELATELAGSRSRRLARAAATDPLRELRERLRARIAPSPAASVEDGGVIAEGVDPRLDEARSLAHDSKRHILAVEERERERTGIASLKIRYNRVFGYSIEISKANAAKVPADYQRRQTLVNAERYVTPEIQSLEDRILKAEDEQRALERALYDEARNWVAAAAPGLAALGRAVAEIDVLSGWAELAARHGWHRPEVLPAGSGVRIADGRHPVVEAALGADFVPNDAELDPGQSQIVLLTGPNMGGKSTYLRQVALIVLIAQTGCFVPAKSAAIGAVDRIFSRVGASDDLARGESTFMVEMIETANILRFATPESLVILDEVGRGTATFDGLSLAWAIVEHLHEGPRPLTLFATHYHELTELESLLPRVVNRTMAVKEWQDRILFLRRVVPGSADKSYGLHVARLAGIPEPVVERAEQVLRNLEAKEFDPTSGRPRLAEGASFAAERPGQMPLFTPAEEIVAKILREADLDRLTPLAALNLLASLQDRLK